MMMIVKCAGCSAPIQDRFLMTVLDKTWHSDCVLCCVCGIPLADRCFSREGKLFCRDDFLRIFGTKCSGCEQVILPHDLVRRARDRIYHVACFVCMACKRQLSTGEQLHVIGDRHFLCGRDYFRLAEEEQALEGDGETRDDKKDIDPHGKMTSLPEGCSLEMWAKMEDEEQYEVGPSEHAATTTTTTTTTAAVAAAAAVATTRMAKHDEPMMMMMMADDCYDDGLSASGGDESLDSCPGLESTSLNADRCSRASAGDPGKVKDVDRSILGESACSLDGQVDNQNTSTVGKRRGPRTTIKAKQLETLKNAFANTPKPTRHIREQLAQETGLNMRVIQVWFQNRRSKERRMKQFNAQGLRRNFFRNPRRMARGSTLGDSLNGAPHPLLLMDYYTKVEDVPGEFMTRPRGCPAVHSCYQNQSETSELYETQNFYAGTEVLYPEFYSPMGLSHVTQATNQMQGMMLPLANQRAAVSAVSSLVSSANQVPYTEFHSEPATTAQFQTANRNLLNLPSHPSQKILQNPRNHPRTNVGQSRRNSPSIGLDIVQSEMGLGARNIILPVDYDSYYDKQPFTAGVTSSSSLLSSSSSSFNKEPSSSLFSTSNSFLFGDKPGQLQNHGNNNINANNNIDNSNDNNGNKDDGDEDDNYDSDTKNIEKYIIIAPSV